MWQKDFKKAYNLKIPEWGTAAHSFLYGDRLICVGGGAGTTCVAFDKRTGKELWRALTSRQPGYCPPVIHTFGGLRQLIIWHCDAVEALNPQTGKVYWSVPLRPTFGMSIGQPVATGNRLFVMSFNRVSACIEVAADGQSAQIAWRGNTRRGAGGVLQVGGPKGQQSCEGCLCRVGSCFLEVSLLVGSPVLTIACLGHVYFVFPSVLLPLSRIF